MKTEPRKSHLNPSQAQILSALKRRPKTGFTRRELEVACKRTRGTICARVGELLERNLVFKDGRRLDLVTKKRVEVLRATEH